MKTGTFSSPSDFSDPLAGKMKFYFWTILLTHAFLWSFLPPFFMPSFLCDSWEMMVIGSNWVLSTYKHPAFQGWVAEMVRQVLQGPDWVPYVCSQLAVILSVYGIWRLSQKFLSSPLALIAALTMLSYVYFQYSSTLYNNRTFLRAFWVLSVLFLWNALETNKCRDWILTGICLAAGLYCKLTMFLLVFTIVCYMMVDPKARQYWKQPGPYVTTGVCFLLFLPLLMYLISTDFACFTYAHHSITHDKTSLFFAPSEWFRLWHPIGFLLAQIPILLLMAISLLPLLGFHWEFRRKALWQNAESRFLTFFFLFPICFQLAVIFLVGGRCRTALGCHLWLFFTLFSLYFCKVHLTRVSWQRSIHLILFLIFFCFGTWATIETMRPVWQDNKFVREYFPAKVLAEHVESVWQERYSVPLEYVRGDDWLAASASIWGKTRPTVYSPLWATDELFLEKGGILLWLDESCSQKVSCFDCYENPDFSYCKKTGRVDEWLKRFPDAEILPTLEIPQKSCFDVPSIKVCMAIVPPKDGDSP